MKKTTLLIGLLAILIAIVGSTALAADKRVAVLVQVATPDSLPGTQVANTVLKMVARNLKAGDGIVLIAFERVVKAARQLKIGREPTALQIKALAHTVGADRVVILRVAVTDHFRVVINAIEFIASGRTVFEFRALASAPQLDRALERAMHSLLDHLIPALLRL